MLDVIGNTIIFSLNPANDSDAVCRLGVMITVTCQFGFMALIGLRMYRAQSVFTAYEEFLEWQKDQILSDNYLNTSHIEDTNLRRSGLRRVREGHFSGSTNSDASESVILSDQQDKSFNNIPLRNEDENKDL